MKPGISKRSTGNIQTLSLDNQSISRDNHSIKQSSNKTHTHKLNNKHHEAEEAKE